MPSPTCWLCQGEIAVGAPYVNSMLFGPAHPGCDDGTVAGMNAYRAAVEKSEKQRRPHETPPDNNFNLGLPEETL